MSDWAYPAAIAVNGLIWLAVCVVFATRRWASAFHPLSYYLFFHGLVFVVRPLVSEIYDFDNIYTIYQFMPSQADRITVMVASALGLLAFAAGAAYTGSTPMVAGRRALLTSPDRRLGLPLALMVLVCLPVGLWSYWSNLGNLGDTMERVAGTGISINTEGTGYFKEAQVMLAPVAIVIAWYFRFRWWALLPAIAFVFLRATTGSRWPFIVLVATLVLLYLAIRGRSWPGWWSLPLGAALLTLFHIIGRSRGIGLRNAVFGGDRSVPEAGRDGDRFLEGMDFANREYFEYLVWAIPDRTQTYGWFVHNLQILTEPIPRALWPDKPVGPPIQLYQLFDYGSPIGMTRSLPGEGWAQLGWGGVLGWCGVVGLVVGLLYTKFAREDRSPLIFLGYIVLAPQLIQFFRDGVVISLLKSSLFFLLPIFVLLVFDRLLNGSAVHRLGPVGTQPPEPLRVPISPAERRARMAASWRPE